MGVLATLKLCFIASFPDVIKAISVRKGMSCFVVAFEVGDLCPSRAHKISSDDASRRMEHTCLHQ